MLKIGLDAKWLPDTDNMLSYGARDIEGNVLCVLPVMCCTIVSIQVYMLTVTVVHCWLVYFGGLFNLLQLFCNSHFVLLYL